MKRFLPPGLLVAGCLLLTPPARPADAKAVVKTGGPFEVEVVKDQAYYDGKDADPEKHKLDLYLPKGQKDFPVLFFVHGGSWKSGDKKIYAPLGNLFAQNGVGTVIISYRLSPKVQHPAHVEDVARAFAWTKANVAKHGGRADQVVVSGHSAGGHLVALLATDPTYLKAHKLDLSDIKAVIALSGVYDITPGKVFEPAFGKDEEVVRNASPLKHVKEKHPPFLFLYADKDYPTLDRMAEETCKALQKAKCEASTLQISDRTHVTIIRSLASNVEDPATQAMLEFLAKHTGLKLTAREPKKGD